ncbi:MAG TPA: Asp-tRNA(Asn)/Glu-tRNA(Gln) amidotransferase subunit GatC, partial [Candidatus Paceibacterota bacterium]|nr:Asp-tRNA(Asn)/Glu-tRNA(Gln) amidotransferase subunit GatC [Candidatus Paceibacterota bacterium]
DLGKILDYVKQLQELDTNNVEPMTGGTLLENICREDKIDEQKQDISKELKKSASNLKDNSFKIPPIF